MGVKGVWVLHHKGKYRIGNRYWTLMSVALPGHPPSDLIIYLITALCVHTFSCRMRNFTVRILVSANFKAFTKILFLRNFRLYSIRIPGQLWVMCCGSRTGKAVYASAPRIHWLVTHKGTTWRVAVMCWNCQIELLLSCSLNSTLAIVVHFRGGNY